MKKNRKNRIYRVSLKQKKEETPKKRERGTTISIVISESLNNKEEILQELLKPIVIKPNNNQFLTMTDSVKEQNNSSEREILNPASASLICKTKGK